MTNEGDNTQTPTWFTIFSVLFVLWNLFGCAVFCQGMFVLNNKEALLDAGLNEAQAKLTLSTPTWVNTAFGVAVVFGVMGSVALVARKKPAIPLLSISLLGVLVQNTYNYLLSNTVEIMGVGASPMVIVGAIAAIPFALFSVKKGWLR